MVFLKEIFEKVNFAKKISRRQKEHEKLLIGIELTFKPFGLLESSIQIDRITIGWFILHFKGVG